MLRPIKLALKGQRAAACQLMKTLVPPPIGDIPAGIPPPTAEGETPAVTSATGLHDAAFSGR